MRVLHALRHHAQAAVLQEHLGNVCPVFIGAEPDFPFSAQRDDGNRPTVIHLRGVIRVPPQVVASILIPIQEGGFKFAAQFCLDRGFNRSQGRRPRLWQVLSYAGTLPYT